jgi:hypothetical protein
VEQSIKNMENELNYIAPEKVISPRRFWTLLVILDPGSEENIALCVGRWGTAACLGMRWNGTEDNPLGNPQSRGIPTWFVIPAGSYANAIIESLPPEKKSLARNFLPA